MKFLMVFFAAVLVSCGAMPSTIDDATKCNLGCAIAGDRLTDATCSDLCTYIESSRIGRRMCESACVEALETGKKQCVDVCIDAI